MDRADAPAKSPQLSMNSALTVCSRWTPCPSTRNVLQRERGFALLIAFSNQDSADVMADLEQLYRADPNTPASEALIQKLIPAMATESRLLAERTLRDMAKAGVA